MTSLWITKVSSTYLHQNLGGRVQCLGVFALSAPSKGLLLRDLLGNPWPHPQPFQRTGLGRRNRYFSDKISLAESELSQASSSQSSQEDSTLQAESAVLPQAVRHSASLRASQAGNSSSQSLSCIFNPQVKPQAHIPRYFYISNAPLKIYGKTHH